MGLRVPSTLACSGVRFDLQRGAHVGLCENVVEGLFEPFEQQIEFRLGVRERGRKAENVVAESAENQAVFIRGGGDPSRIA